MNKFRVLLNSFLSHVLNKCDKSDVEYQWIEISEKKNKPPEDYLHIKATCPVCGRVKEGYFREEEVKAAQKRNEINKMRRELWMHPIGKIKKGQGQVKDTWELNENKNN